VIRRLLVTWIVLTISIAIATALVPVVDVDGGLGGFLKVALIFGVVNLLLGPILRLLTLPLTLLTLGLFALVVNAMMFGLTSWLTDSLSVDGFFPAFWAALVISIVGSILHAVLRRERPAERV